MSQSLNDLHLTMIPSGQSPYGPNIQKYTNDYYKLNFMTPPIKITTNRNDLENLN